jgi:hypothetical protein
MTSLKVLGLGAGLPSNKTGLLKLAFTNGSEKIKRSISTIPFFNSLTMSNFKSIHKRLNLKKTTVYCKTSSIKVIRSMNMSFNEYVPLDYHLSFI